MNKIKLGMIGLGCRGKSLMRLSIILGVEVEVVAVCDEYIDRAEQSADYVFEKTGKRPSLITDDYNEVLSSGLVDCVIVSTSWEDHIRVSIAAMKAHIPVGCEVGGAYSIQNCFDLVKTYEETKTPFMMLENCCYGQKELMTLEMARKGLFGKISRCTGGYTHDLRDEVFDGHKTKHYRLRNYMRRCCDNYPTHQLLPIAKILDINRGNRMVSLVSVASKSQGMKKYALDHKDEAPHLADAEFMQGDVIDTIIKCAGGETIHLTLDTCLPTFYSRNFSVAGTKGRYVEMNDSIYLEDIHKIPENEWVWKHNWGNAKEYYEKNEPYIWKKYGEAARGSGHGGMDYMVLTAFFEAVKNNYPMPIDVYDAASVMAISYLSESSISMGGMPVAIPDFTGGRWVKYKKEKSDWEFCLNG